MVELGRAPEVHALPNCRCELLKVPALLLCKLRGPGSRRLALPRVDLRYVVGPDTKEQVCKLSELRTQLSIKVGQESPQRGPAYIPQTACSQELLRVFLTEPHARLRPNEQRPALS